jgi:NADPH:quinone reductase-like Zn-dependent oxidoreductase
VLNSGATGTAGRIAIQAARHLGAARIIGTGRRVDSLKGAGLDAVIDLTQSDEQVRDALAAEAERGIDVVIDYLWGHPTELLLEALARTFKPGGSRQTRLIEVGETAGKTITLPGSTLRSVDLHMLGSGFGSVSLERVWNAISTMFDLAAKGEFSIDVESTPLADVEAAWNRNSEGRRIVFTMK